MTNRRKPSPPSLRMTVAERAEQAAREAAAPVARRRRLAIVAGGTVGVLAIVAVVVALAIARTGSDPAPQVDATALRLGCTSCHTADGARSEGPTWKGLWGSTVMLTDESSVVVDEDYVRRSILDPGAQVPVGYTASMPTLEVTPDQLDHLVAYLRTLA